MTNDERIAEAIARAVADAPPLPADALALLKRLGFPFRPRIEDSQATEPEPTDIEGAA